MQLWVDSLIFQAKPLRLSKCTKTTADALHQSAVPDLTFCAGIKLNKRVSLPRYKNSVSLRHMLTAETALLMKSHRNPVASPKDLAKQFAELKRLRLEVKKLEKAQKSMATEAQSKQSPTA